MNDYMLFYLISLNVAVYLLFQHDKKQAKKKGARVPEQHLMILIGLGGAIGGLMGMYFLCHKTQKKKFQFWLPIFTAVHAVFLFPMLFFTPKQWLYTLIVNFSA